MAPKPLDIQKEGLSKSLKTIQGRKDKLNTKLSRKKTISSADEQWLDNEANTVDAQRVLNEETKSLKNTVLITSDENKSKHLISLHYW